MIALNVDYGSSLNCTIHWFKTESEALDVLKLCGPLGVERMRICDSTGRRLWSGNWNHRTGRFQFYDSAHSPTL